MHHATAQNFKPARILADLTSLTTTDKTFHIHFCGRFCERKIRCAETCAHILPKHAAGKIDQCTFQVSEGDVLANGESFHLIKLDLGARGNLFITKKNPRHRNTDRWWVLRVRGYRLQHRTD